MRKTLNYQFYTTDANTYGFCHIKSMVVCKQVTLTCQIFGLSTVEILAWFDLLVATKPERKKHTYFTYLRVNTAAVNNSPANLAFEDLNKN